MTGKNIDITALHAALDAIEELNQTMTDENGHRWDRSDLIGQEIRAMRGIIRGAAESPRVINVFHPDVESYGLGWPQAECLIVSVQATDRAAQLAGQTLAKWLEQADGQPLSQECCEKLAHIIRSSVIEPARSILLATSQPAPETLNAAYNRGYDDCLYSAGQTADPESRPVTLTYTNWKGETAQRTIIPRRVWWGSTEWHPEPQWLLTAFDVGKEAERDFALKDFDQPAQPVAVEFSFKLDTSPVRAMLDAAEDHFAHLGTVSATIRVNALRHGATEDEINDFISGKADFVAWMQDRVKPQPITVQDAARVVLISSDRGVCVGGRWDGWLMIRHHDGHWVSHHKLDAVDLRTEMTDALRAIAEGRV